MTFDTLLDFVFDIYDLIMTTGQLLIGWFNTQIPEEVITILGLPSTTTNLELMLGTFVPLMLLLTLVGAITKALTPM